MFWSGYRNIKCFTVFRRWMWCWDGCGWWKWETLWFNWHYKYLSKKHTWAYREGNRQISTNALPSLHIKMMNRLECAPASILIQVNMTLIWLIRIQWKWIKVSIHGPNVAVVMVTLAKGWSQPWSSCWAKKHQAHPAFFRVFVLTMAPAVF